jgi:hypothetical protein
MIHVLDQSRAYGTKSGLGRYPCTCGVYFYSLGAWFAHEAEVKRMEQRLTAKSATTFGQLATGRVTPKTPKPTSRRVWLNLYMENRYGSVCYGGAYSSKTEADKNTRIMEPRTHCLEIDLEAEDKLAQLKQRARELLDQQKGWADGDLEASLALYFIKDWWKLVEEELL